MNKSTAIWRVQPLADADQQWWSAWDRLNETSLQAHPLLSSDMARLLCAHFPPAAACVATLTTDREPVAQAILVRNGRAKWSLFNPSQAPVSLVVFDRSKSDWAASFAGLLSRLPGTNLALEFPVQDPHCSPLTVGSPLLHKAIWGTTVGVSCAGSFDAYWESRSKDLKHNMRRYLKRINEEYAENWAFIRHADASSIGAAVDRYAALESRGWKGKEGTALTQDNAQGKFYRGLLESKAAQGHAAVYELRFGDALAASRLTISGPTMHIILKTTYDEELSRFAPGRVHLHLLLKALFEDSVRRPVEFYTRANKDTMAWSTDQRDIETATLYRNRLVAGVLAAKRRWATRRDSAAPTSES
jgi:CelD/BcsL family acetyltransferase involved in cellulose biosynthesis